MIDWDRVAELRWEIGPEDFDQVVELFLEEVHATINKLRQAPDPDDLEADLHFLKGSALNLGFAQFSERCHAAERLIANGQSDNVDLSALLRCFDHSMASFTEELPQRFAA